MRQLTHLGDELADFADTAAVLALADLVITVDTSVAHLAGALGRPTLDPAAVLAGLALDARPRKPVVSGRAAVPPAGPDGDWDSVLTRVAQELSSV